MPLGKTEAGRDAVAHPNPASAWIAAWGIAVGFVISTAAMAGGCGELEERPVSPSFGGNFGGFDDGAFDEDSGSDEGSGSGEIDEPEAGSSTGAEPEPEPDADADSGPSDDDAGDSGPVDDEPEMPAFGDFTFNILLRQQVQACSSCGIWFDWQGDPADKPRLEVVWSVGGGAPQLSQFQHDASSPNAFGFFIGPDVQGDPEQRKHALLVKQGPARTGMFIADISEIPPEASIVSATLLLHIHTDEGLAWSDFGSVLHVHEGTRLWDWTADWEHARTGESWTTPGGDFGPFIREISAQNDLHGMGFNKANPDAAFDFTDYVVQLQEAR